MTAVQASLTGAINTAGGRVAHGYLSVRCAAAVMAWLDWGRVDFVRLTDKVSLVGRLQRLRGAEIPGVAVSGGR